MAAFLFRVYQWFSRGGVAIIMGTTGLVLLPPGPNLQRPGWELGTAPFAHLHSSTSGPLSRFVPIFVTVQKAFVSALMS